MDLQNIEIELAKLQKTNSEYANDIMYLKNKVTKLEEELSGVKYEIASIYKSLDTKEDIVYTGW